MGPPGAGKTVFLKMLAGRFKPSADLRISGSVKYNGCTSNEFVVERTVGLVDQYDSALLSAAQHPHRIIENILHLLGYMLDP